MGVCNNCHGPQGPQDYYVKLEDKDVMLSPYFCHCGAVENTVEDTYGNIKWLLENVNNCTGLTSRKIDIFRGSIGVCNGPDDFKHADLMEAALQHSKQLGFVVDDDKGNWKLTESGKEFIK